MSHTFIRKTGLLAGTLAAFTWAGCASGPRLGVMDEADSAIGLAERTELVTTQPQLLAEAKYHQALAARAFASGDTEAAELHGHLALQKVRTADNLDVGLQRRALLVAQQAAQRPPDQTMTPGSEPGADTPMPPTRDPKPTVVGRRAHGVDVPAVAGSPLPPYPGRHQGAWESGAEEADALIHAAEDARSLVVILGQESDGRMAEGDDLLDVARRARAIRHLQRAIGKAREALVVFYVVRLAPAAPPQSALATDEGRSKPKDVVTAATRKSLVKLEGERQRLLSKGLDTLCPTEAGAFSALLALAQEAADAAEGDKTQAYVQEARVWVDACEKTLFAKKEALGRDIAQMQGTLEELRVANDTSLNVAGLKSTLAEVEALRRRGSLVEARSKFDALVITAIDLTRQAAEAKRREEASPGKAPVPTPDGARKEVVPGAVVVPNGPSTPKKHNEIKTSTSRKENVAPAPEGAAVPKTPVPSPKPKADAAPAPEGGGPAPKRPSEEDPVKP